MPTSTADPHLYTADYKPIGRDPTPLTFSGCSDAPAAPGLPDMTGKRILVIGASGGVGSHLVDRYAAAGAHVIIASRTPATAATALEAAQARNPGAKLTAVAGDTNSYASAAAFADKVCSEGPVDHVTLAIGGWWSGPSLWEASEEDVNTFFNVIPTAYLANLAAWAPRLPKGNAVIWILGASGLMPIPGSGIVNMASASLVMAQQVVEREIVRTGAQFRLFSLVNGSINTRNRAKELRNPDFPDADEMADLSLALMERRDVVSQGLTMITREHLAGYLKQLGITPKC